MLFLLAFAASALGGTLGMASGVFIVPLLTIAGVDLHAAIGASIISVIACSCASAPAFLEARLVNIRLAVVLETATTLGALTGVLLVGIIPIADLFLLFATILLVSAYQMSVRRRAAVVIDEGPASSLDGAYPDPVLGRDVPYRVRRLPAGMGLMYGAGLVSALLGIGSGVLKIPAMDTALRLPIKVSSGTSSFMIGVTGAASAGAYLLRGQIDVHVAAPVALGSVLGAALGARVMLYLSGERLRIVFVGVLLVLAAQMALGAFGIDLVRGAG